MRASARGRAPWFLLGVTLLVGACGATTIKGSGKVVTKDYSVSSFSRLQVSDAFIVNLSVGDAEAVTVRVDDNLVDRLDVGASGETLHLGLKSGTSVRDATLEADVTVRSLSSLELSGASQIRWSDSLTGQKLDARLSGAAMVEGPVQLGEIDLGLSGASQARLLGTADRVVIDGSGASQIESLDLQARDLEITLSGATQATLSVSDTISADLSGASQLHYMGSPQFTKKDLSGASTVEPVQGP